MAEDNRRSQFTAEQRAFCVMKYQKYSPSGYNVSSRVLRDFENHFPGVRVPSKSALLKMVAKFDKLFTVHNCNSKSSPGESHSGHRKTVRTPANIEAVRAAVTADTTKELFDPSVNTSSRNSLGLSASSFNRILKEDLKYHCFKMIKKCSFLV